MPDVAPYPECLGTGIGPLRSAGLDGSGVRIGLLDTGVAGDHPALRGRIADFTLFDEVGNPCPVSLPVDTGNHGTHIAGILCGSPIGGAEIGIAPGAELWVGAVLNAGENVVRILRGLEAALSSGIRLLCLPLGLPGQNPILFPMMQAIRSAGILPIAAIGNGRSGASHSPANYPNVLSVGAVDGKNRPPTFSGSLWHHRDGVCMKPELLAPGVDIRSAHPPFGERRRGGTSQACAYVAGVAGLLFQAYPDATIEQVEWALVQSAEPLDPEYAHRGRYGLLDPEHALALLGTAPSSPGFSLSTPSLPQRYCSPELSAIVEGPPLKSIRCVLAVKEGSAAESTIQRTATTLGEEAEETYYLPCGRTAIVTASTRFVRALIQAPNVWISSCRIVNNPFS